MPNDSTPNYKASAAKTATASAAPNPVPAALKETIMTPDGQLVQVITKPVPTPRGMPNLPVNARTRKRHKLAVAALRTPDEIVKDQVNGFVIFIREHAIVGLAVGFMIATQAQSVIRQLVESFIDPMIALVFGGDKLNELVITVSLFGNHTGIKYGAFLYALINLLAVLVTIYVLVRTLKLEKLDKSGKA
jgi:large-conductance mechanosensitive channel